MTEKVISTSESTLRECGVCPRGCGADRTAGEAGFCGIGSVARVASAGAHFGEEPVLVGPGGSGTIFFQGCNLGCVFCQNFDISQQDDGPEVPTDQLAELMCQLESRGCSNINLVSPTHVGPQVREAVALAKERGLKLPVVYNCGGYESLEMLHLLAGLVDIYMPDFKYASADIGLKYSGVPDYPQVAAIALAQMYHQVGPLQLDDDGLALRGVLVRHLVLPLDLAGSRRVVETVAEIAPGCGINVMDQYRPCFRASDFPELLQLPKAADIRSLRKHAVRLGLVRVD